MPSMQTLQVGDSYRAPASSAAQAERVFARPGEIIWTRNDWSSPVGVLHSLGTTRRESHVNGLSFIWAHVNVPELFLGHRATILLLQGTPLSRLLLPGEFQIYTGETRVNVGHVVLRVDPWNYWRPRPTLTGLVLASLGEIPAELSAADVLGALAADSAT